MSLRVRDAAALLVCAMIALPAAGAESGGGTRAGEIEVVAGGIGEAELTALAAREKEFNLKLVFSLDREGVARGTRDGVKDRC